MTKKQLNHLETGDLLLYTSHNSGMEICEVISDCVHSKDTVRIKTMILWTRTNSQFSTDSHVPPTDEYELNMVSMIDYTVL